MLSRGWTFAIWELFIFFIHAIIQKKIALILNKQKNKCVCAHETTIYYNQNEDENEKIEHIYTTKIDLGLDMDTNIVNIKSVSLSW